MPSPTWYFDGVLRRIYEVPPGASHTLVGGYRVYDGGPAPAAMLTVDIKRDLWSRWVDWQAQNDWALPAMSAAGGSVRPTGEGGSADYSIRTDNGWRLVLANYEHESIFLGNLFPVGADSLYDYTRITSIPPPFPRQQGAAMVLTYSYATSGADAAGVADAVWGHASAINLIDRASIAAAILRNKTVTDPVTGLMTVYTDDGVTPMLVAQLFEDAAGTQPYRGQGAEYRGRLS